MRRISLVVALALTSQIALAEIMEIQPAPDGQPGVVWSDGTPAIKTEAAPLPVVPQVVAPKQLSAEELQRLFPVDARHRKGPGVMWSEVGGAKQVSSPMAEVFTGSTNKNLVQKVAETHPGADYETIKVVVRAAEKYATPDLTVNDILALVSLESGFNCKAISSQGAAGCMQIMPKAWGLSRSQLINDLEFSVRKGVEIFTDYHSQLGSKTAALQAYNLGIGAYQSGKRAPGYVRLFNSKLGKITRNKPYEVL